MPTDSPLKTISKEELAALPTKEFAGHPVIVVNNEQSCNAINQIRASKSIIGFDTETRPSFHRGVSYPVSLIQLSVGEVCYLFRLNKLGEIPPYLFALLEDETVIKVGLSLHDDFKQLHTYGLENPRGFIDIQHLVKRFNIGETSLSKIYAILFGKKISKRQRLSNWEADQLTLKQQAYASLDAMACVEIYEELLKRGACIYADENL